MTSQIVFEKMNGAGNEIIVADMRGREERLEPEAITRIAGQIPFDQLMELRTLSGSDSETGVLIHNSDGSPAGACGNGMRCVTAWLEQRQPRGEWQFRTRAGLLGAIVNADGTISVDMGMPRFGWDQIPLAEEFADTTRIELQVGPIDNPVLHSPSVASMGNPHAVFWVEGDPAALDLHRFGPLLEHHPLFPEGANITVARIDGPAAMTIRTWERGAGLTLACGSAACAAAVSAARKGLTGRRVAVTVPSGAVLEIDWREDNHVVMTGPVEFEFSGMLDPATGEIASS